MTLLAQSDPDYSMMSRRWSGEILITSDIAQEIARRVHHNRHGPEDLAANEPLSVKNGGNVWIVSGAKSREDVSPHPLRDGPFVIKISKFDGQILSYAFPLTEPSDS